MRRNGVSHSSYYLLDQLFNPRLVSENLDRADALELKLYEINEVR